MNDPDADSAVTKNRRCPNIAADIFQPLLAFFARRPLARILSTFLCALIIAVRPFARLGGPYAFLVLALNELVFSVQENLAQQLELTCLNIIGALLGIGLSTLAKYIASLAGPDTNAARATCFVFLILISFLGSFLTPSNTFTLVINHYIAPTAGVAKSRLVRLQLSTRISCFISVWILTSNIGVPQARILPLNVLLIFDTKVFSMSFQTRATFYGSRSLPPSYPSYPC